MVLQALKTHLVLIALAAVSALTALYLYRELRKAKRALVTEKPEECTSALCQDGQQPPAKRVRFEEAGRSSGKAAGANDPPPHDLDTVATKPKQPLRSAPGATPRPSGALESTE